MRWLVVAALLLPRPAGAADARWDRWQLLMWQDHTAAQFRGLAALGFTGAKVRATGGVVDAAGLADRTAAGLPVYLENVATDFYAPYHRYTEGRAVTWLFDAVRARHRAEPDDPGVFVRTPSLSDPAWQERVRTRLDTLVRAHAGQGRLFYNLADEGGIADLAAAWDFDQSPDSLAGFRAWLRTQYADLAALNTQWGTGFAAWDDVRPELTDTAMRRTDGNFSAWSDFKAWMDYAYMLAVRGGTRAVHAADPGALAALEGGQVPGWGGYDYALLATAVDVMEVYDVGDSLDLAVAFNPALIPLRTSFGRGPRERHAAWRTLLHGGRGTIVWDEDDDVVAADGSPGPRGIELAALSRDLAPVAAVLRSGRPAPDGVAVLYSQASFRVRWLLDRQAGDRDWAARDAEREYDDNAWREGRRMLLRKLAEAGVQPRIVAVPGEAELAGVRVLLLPQVIALSDGDVAAVRAFMARGGTVLADTEPGAFDGHGRRRAALPLPEVARPEAVRMTTGATDPAGLAALTGLLARAGAPPRVAMAGPDGQPATGVEARWFETPGGPVLAVQAGVPWGGPPSLTLRLPARVGVTDVRTGQDLGVLDRVELALDAIEPRVLLFRTGTDGAVAPAGRP